MKRIAIICFLLVCMGNPAFARMPGCTKAQEQVIKTSVAVAKRLVVRAAAAVGDNEIYERWFGKYSPSAGEDVRRNLKNLAKGLRSGSVTAQCERISPSGCERGTYAYVYSDEAYMIHICPEFFRQPTMDQLRPGTPRSDNGSQAGTIVHEVSHFIVVAETEDHCYSRTECKSMALRHPQRAIDNADSYQYFVEDITYFGAPDQN